MARLTVTVADSTGTGTGTRTRTSAATVTTGAASPITTKKPIPSPESQPVRTLEPWVALAVLGQLVRRLGRAVLMIHTDCGVSCSWR